jgi:hypothetical protein
MRPFRRLGDMMALSPADIQTYAANAGFAGPDLATAVAIALAESFPSGNPNSYNPESAARGGTPQGKGSYGLWQIYLKMHPEFAGHNLFDPQTNANDAYSIYARRGGFSDWATYTSGTYAAYLPSIPPAPLTLDASTGQPINDSTPTPASTSDTLTPLLAPMQASIIPTSLPSPGVLFGLAAAAIGAYVVMEDLL